MASSVSTKDPLLSLESVLEYAGLRGGLREGVEWVEEAAAGSSLVGERGFELVRFLWRPGEAEAVLLDFWLGWKRSEVRPGLDLAREVVLADQVL